MTRTNRRLKSGRTLTLPKVLKPIPAAAPAAPPAPVEDPRVLASVAESPPVRCGRLVQHDSLRWRCACGGSGPVGRSPDGMPYVNDEMLRHAPGERKE